MKKLTIDFEHCYGIKKLSYTFDFSSRKAFSIYAPNGTMKTSFAKAFKDCCNNSESSDKIFPDRQCKRQIVNSEGQSITPSEVFVIEPYIESYKSEKASTLLVNQELKTSYEAILKKLEEHKGILLNKLKQLSGLTGKIITPETELTKVFKKPFLKYWLTLNLLY